MGLGQVGKSRVQGFLAGATAAATGEAGATTAGVAPAAGAVATGNGNGYTKSPGSAQGGIAAAGLVDVAVL